MYAQKSSVESYAHSCKLLEKHGTKHQYGATPNCGCQDGNFTLKSILHLQQQHNQDTYIVFADLVKAYDTYNHELMLKILEQYGVGYCSRYYEARSASGRASGEKFKAQIVIFRILLAVNRFPRISWKSKSC